MRRMDYVHINGEGELIERPNGILVDWVEYERLLKLLERGWEIILGDDNQAKRQWISDVGHATDFSFTAQRRDEHG